MRRQTLAAASLLLLTACASAPMAVPERDSQAKQFAPAAGKAVVYIYRNENFGGAVKIPISVNSRLIGDTVANSYFRLVLDPGSYAIQCKAEKDSALTVQAEAGKVYFVWQEMKMGMWAAGCSMHLASDEEGRKAVLECKLLDAPESLPN